MVCLLQPKICFLAPLREFTKSRSVFIFIMILFLLFYLLIIWFIYLNIKFIYVLFYLFVSLLFLIQLSLIGPSDRSPTDWFSQTGRLSMSQLLKIDSTRTIKSTVSDLWPPPHCRITPLSQWSETHQMLPTCQGCKEIEQLWKKTSTTFSTSPPTEKAPQYWC